MLWRLLNSASQSVGRASLHRSLVQIFLRSPLFHRFVRHSAPERAKEITAVFTQELKNSVKKVFRK
jgi:hypothetical protein